ncbi:hypothetical protein QYE76_062749 [Lolium multiflorum]|uniref:Uncharacterized protein n=1 Tax=Lolium multiflorum TaxID=4521 RepID=A0AAD8W8F2_LOLMU|nr:hypothetical protein QYE76_062749 [Lolium multiflorum]
MYAGEKDVDRLSKDLPLKDFEKLIQRISSLSKKDAIPSSCRITPYSGANPLTENHPVLASLPPLPEGGEVEERTVVDDDNQGTSRPESEVAVSQKSAASSEKEAESEATSSTRSLPPAVSPRNKRKRDEGVDSGTSKATPPPAEEVGPEKKAAFNLYEDALVSSSAKRLHEAENALSDKVTEQAAREKDILSRLQSQSRRFVRRTHQEYELESPEGDELLDALSLLEIHGDEARDGLADAEAGLSKLFPYFFPKKEEPNTFAALAKCFNLMEDLGLKLRQEGLKIGVEGTIALVADSQQNVDWAKVADIEEMETKKWQTLIKAAKPPSKPILALLGCKPASAPSSSKPEVK